MSAMWEMIQPAETPASDDWSSRILPSIVIPMQVNENEYKRGARLLAYQQLLLRMFGAGFECVPISGGFSGSSVVKISPLDVLGGREEAVIVKLDSAANIRSEVAYSVQAQVALGDVAARILGDPLYVRSDLDGTEYGAFKMELAGAVLQVPELSASSDTQPMINTFKDLLIFEAEEAVLRERFTVPHMIESVVSPFGSVPMIVKDLFGEESSATRKLRRFEAVGISAASAARRRFSVTDPLHPSGADFLASRLPPDLPNLPPQVDKAVHLLQASLPFLTSQGRVSGTASASLVDRVNVALAEVKGGLAKFAPSGWKLLRGLCHGDLNGSNIIIDATEKMWLIDFASARKLPLSSDLVKLASCALFEYTVVPVSLQMIRRMHAECEVGVELIAKWLRLDDVGRVEDLVGRVGGGEGRSVDALLEELHEMDPLSWTPAVVRRVRARIADSDQEFERTMREGLGLILKYLPASFAMTDAGSTTTRRMTVFEGVEGLLSLKAASAVTATTSTTAVGGGGGGAKTAAPSIQFALDMCARMSLYSYTDVEQLILQVQAEEPNGLSAWDVSLVEPSVVALRELARLVRYNDISPWMKILVTEAVEALAKEVLVEMAHLSAATPSVASSDPDITHPDTLHPDTFQQQDDQRSNILHQTRSDDIIRIRPVLTSLVPYHSTVGAVSHDHHQPNTPPQSGPTWGVEEGRKYLKFVRSKFGFLVDFVSGKQLDVSTQCCHLKLTACDNPSQIIDLFTRSSSGGEGYIVSGMPGSGKTCLLKQLLVDQSTSLSIPIFIPAVELCTLPSNSSENRSNICVIDAYLCRAFGDDEHRLSFLKHIVSHSPSRLLLLIDGVDDLSPTQITQLMNCLSNHAKRGSTVVATMRTGGVDSACWAGGAVGGLMVRCEIAPLDSDQRRAVAKARFGSTAGSKDLLRQFEGFIDRFDSSGSAGGGGVGLTRTPAFVSMLLCYWLQRGDVGNSSSRPPSALGERQLSSMGPGLTRATTMMSDFAPTPVEPFASTPAGLGLLSRSVSPVTATISNMTNSTTTSPPGVYGSITEVYRVVVSVLIHRYQVFQESDRTKVRESSKRLGQLLRMIAFRIKSESLLWVPQETVVEWISDIGLDEVSGVPRVMDDEFFRSTSSPYTRGASFPSTGTTPSASTSILAAATSAWLRLADHVRVGKFPLLSYSLTLAGSVQFRFSIDAMADYLTADYLATNPVVDGPSLPALIEDKAWEPVMLMLVERAPMKYVRLVERKLTTGQWTPAIRGNGDTVLHAAARTGHLPIFQVLGKSSLLESLISRANSDSLLPLHVAALSGRSTICRLLIEAGADVFATTADGWSALHLAASRHRRDVCSLLIASGRSIERPSYGASTASFSQYGGSFGYLGGASSLSSSLSQLSRNGLEFAQRILTGELSSNAEFIEVAKRVFPELSYFRGRSDTTPDASASVSLDPSEIEFRRTMGAMLSVFWIVSDRYDSFVGQTSSANQLSLASWKKIREWAVHVVGLNTPEAVDAMLSLMAIHDLGKLKDFRADLAPDFKDHDAAMKYIVSTTPEVLPSLGRLPESQQSVLRAVMAVEFNFGQFLQAENLPVNLVAIKDLALRSRPTSVLAFYLFHIFADMAGIMGAISLDGSLFMTETMFKNFDLGIEALTELTDKSPVEVYNQFLETRGAVQFGQPETCGRRRKAMIRLACMSRIFDRPGGTEIERAFNALPVPKQEVLIDHLSRTGFGRTPSDVAYLIYYGPAFMENCRRNSALGLQVGMDFLANIFESAQATFTLPGDDHRAHDNSSTDHVPKGAAVGVSTVSLRGVVVVHISEAAELAKSTKKSNGLSSVCFRILKSSGVRRYTEGTLRISPWCMPDISDCGVDVTAAIVQGEVGLVELSYYETTGGCVGSNRVKSQFDLISALFDQTAVPGLTEQSTTTLTQWLKSCGVDRAIVLTAISISEIGSIQPLVDDFDHLFNKAEAVEFKFWLMDNYAQSVLPSFHSLPLCSQQSVRRILSVPFRFDQFVSCERISVDDVAQLLQLVADGGTDDFFTYCAMSIPSTSNDTAVDVYLQAVALFSSPPAFSEASSSRRGEALLHEYLSVRGEGQGLGLARQMSSPRNAQIVLSEVERFACVRIACLSSVYFPSGGLIVVEAFSALSVSERETLVSALGGGIVSRLRGLSEFLTAAKHNSHVGLDSALRLLVRMVTFIHDTSECSEVSLHPLVDRATTHSVSLPFEFLQVDLATTPHGRCVIVPHRLIPVSSPMVLTEMSKSALSLTSSILSCPIADSVLVDQLVKVYPELSFFIDSSRTHASAAAAKLASETLSPDITVSSVNGDTVGSEIEFKRTVCSMCSLCWVLNDRYDSFTAQQGATGLTAGGSRQGSPMAGGGSATGMGVGESKLSVGSWIEIRDWLKHTFANPETLDALFVYLVIVGVAKVHAPSSPSDWLGDTLRSSPDQLPSFNRLSVKYRVLVEQSIRSRFNFGQFLQAENVPSDMDAFQLFVRSSGGFALNFVLAVSFVQLSGLLGGKSSQSALFMTQNVYDRFRVGREVIKDIQWENPLNVFRRFVVKRGASLLSDLRSEEATALARLMCLARIDNTRSARLLEVAFDELDAGTRRELVDELIAGLGSHGKEAVVLEYLPALLENMRLNGTFPVLFQLELVAKLYRCARACNARTANLSTIANWTRDAQITDPEMLEQIKIVASESRPGDKVNLSIATMETDYHHP